MQRQDIKLRSRDGGGTFDCYVAIPDGAAKAPGIVIASAVQGVDQDMRDLADAFAAKGCSPQRPTCSGAPFRARCRMAMRTVPNVRGRACRASRRANPT